jgi:hypothetical protein
MKRPYLWPSVMACALGLILLALVGNGRLWGNPEGSEGGSYGAFSPLSLPS